MKPLAKEIRIHGNNFLGSIYCQFNIYIMKFTLILLLMLASIEQNASFTIPIGRIKSSEIVSQNHRLNAIFDSNSYINNNKLQEFDYLLQEVSSDDNTNLVHINDNNVQSSRRIISLTNSYDTRNVILASSTTATMPMSTTNDYEDTVLSDDETTNTNSAIGNGDINNNEDIDDPYSNMLGEQLGKIQKFQEQKVSTSSRIEAKLKSMDIQDIVVTLFIPGLLAFVGGRWIFNRASTRVTEQTESILDSFATEMLYHDGDYKEMDLCIDDYKKKLVWMVGSIKTDAMLRRYLESYAKKKTVSPQAIASISYAFTSFKLSEEKAAQVLVSLCRQLGTNKISSAGKLLFLGSRILKSSVGKDALKPIKELIMSTYREEAVAETLVDTSQQAMAEAAYRSTVLGGGKKQQNLTPGWEVLGLSKEVATRIYEEELKQGFVSDRETMYGGQTRKYDKKGRQLDTKTGKLVDPSEATDADDDDNNNSDNDDTVQGGTGIYECGNCGFTMFVAKGRESKFFGPNFKCPECGAKKSEFTAKDPTVE